MAREKRSSIASKAEKDGVGAESQRTGDWQCSPTFIVSPMVSTTTHENKNTNTANRNEETQDANSHQKHLLKAIYSYLSRVTYHLFAQGSLPTFST